jgi:hypothetical protein
MCTSFQLAAKNISLGRQTISKIMAMLSKKISGSLTPLVIPSGFAMILCSRSSLISVFFKRADQKFPPSPESSVGQGYYWAFDNPVPNLAHH